MDKNRSFVVFFLNKKKYALYLSNVERIVRMVEITPLPKAPDMVLGIIDLGGSIIPVFNIRQQFNLNKKEIDLNDCLIISQTSKKKVALRVDEVFGVIHREENEITKTEEILGDLEYIDGVFKLEGGLILIHDLENFLSIRQKKELNQALKEYKRKS